MHDERKRSHVCLNNCVQCPLTDLCYAGKLFQGSSKSGTGPHYGVTQARLAVLIPCIDQQSPPIIG